MPLPALRRQSRERELEEGASLAAKKLSIRIDGELISAVEGQTILQAAKANGKYIPTLCDLEGLTPVGACRLCIVEVSGTDRLFPACTTPMQDGMSVTTIPPSSRNTGAFRWNCCWSSATTCAPPASPTAIANCSPWPPRWASARCALPTTIPSWRRPVPSALRARPQPLHPVHALRAGLRGTGGRACLGDDRRAEFTPGSSAT